MEAGTGIEPVFTDLQSNPVFSENRSVNGKEYQDKAGTARELDTHAAENGEHENENPGALAGATGAEENLPSTAYIWGNVLSRLGIGDTLRLKPRGWYHITPEGGWWKIAVHRPGHPPETILCLSPGHANQLRQSLSDEGMAGLIEGAL